MTPTEHSARASSGLTPDQLARLRPHVVNLRDGELARNADGEGEFHTTEADVRRIFTEHLPRFVEQHGGARVPVVVYAHGGLTPEANGLRTAHHQLQWWLDNGAYPIHFVWETGIVESVADALEGWLAQLTRGWLEDRKNEILETVARIGQGKRIWDEMKKDAETASGERGGARAFADRFGTYVQDHPDSVSVHLIGHSAGSIFHAHLLPALIECGVTHIDTVSLLAPAMRCDLFEQKMRTALTEGHVGHLSLFTMTRDAELNDRCGPLYTRSLLYLVSASFEPEAHAPILGLQESVSADLGLAALFSAASPNASAVWAPVTAGPRDSSRSVSHGSFDDDPDTMNSVARRIVDRDDITGFPAPRGLEGLPERGRSVTTGTSRWVSGSHRKALCIGVDAYPTVGDRLAGCVADARAWSSVLGGLGFDVTSLLDSDATREGILQAMVTLVSGSAEGDVLVVQYSGHGTHVLDLDGDEKAGGDAYDDQDEALCPVDFRTGELLIDDDLGRVWDLLPPGVGVTLLFDSCHSGSANRAPQLGVADAAAHGSNRRYRALTSDDVRRYRALRGAPSTTLPRSGRELLFSACRATEVAYETSGQGDFTRKAIPLVAAAAGTLTNREFLDRVLDGFDPRQHPEIHGAADLHDRLFLVPAADAPPPPATSAPAPTMRVADTDTRIRTVAAFLRATADLIDPPPAG